MGLDAIEIVMAVEEAFDIRIEDAEAETIRTPRQVIDLVMGKVASASPPNGCITHRAFNQLRRVLVSRGGVSRQRISPAMHLSELLPRRNRRALVQEITTDLSIRSPVALQRSAALASSLAAGSIVVGVGVGWFLSGGMAVFAGVCAAALAGGAGLRMTQGYCTEFPKEISTVGAFTRWVMARKPDLAHAQQAAWTREQVAACVKDIVVSILGCEAAYHEDALFVEDLGLG